MITVACVYWKGVFRGRESIYSGEWVAKLKNMVARNLPMPHRFVCLSNVPVSCERIHLLNDWRGWWSKIELFRPGLFDGDRVLYLDLDTIVLKDLTPIVKYPSKFAIMGQPIPRNNYTVKMHPAEGRLTVYHYQSSVFVFDGGMGTELYTDFNDFKMQVFRGDQDYISAKCSAITLFRGDQDYIGNTLPDLDILPRKWMGKLDRVTNAGPPKDMIIGLCMKNKGFRKKNIDFAKQYKWFEEIWQ